VSVTPNIQFREDATRVAADLTHRHLINKALKGYEAKRDEFKGRYQDWQSARTAAAAIKHDAVEHLGRYLEEFERRIIARGVKVFWASTGAQARDYILKVARDNGVQSVIKSKSMTSEEIHLNDALEQAGCEVVESDLGEYIVQLRKEPPYHFVFPSMHLTRHQVSDIFHEKLGSQPTDQPEELTMIARRQLRKKYASADMGITGVNFMVAETGMISITENEGNARLTAALPRIHVAISGIEKVLPRLEDLALFLPMLATAGAGQPMTGYNTLYAGPRQESEVDGPEQFHLVLLDNHRTQLLADAEQRDALRCIRCGACLNVCPIFKNVGGFTYGTTYQGPIGSVITPHLRGLQQWKHLPSASSLCGACTEACPVRIDLHHHLLHHRRNAAAEKPWWVEKILYAGFIFLLNRPKLYALGGRVGAWLQPLHNLIKGTVLDPARPWTRTRDLPRLSARAFRDEWKDHVRQKGGRS